MTNPLASSPFLLSMMNPFVFIYDSGFATPRVSVLLRLLR
jgi:hypothetical protein